MGSRKIHYVKDLPLAESPPLNYAVHSVCISLSMPLHVLVPPAPLVSRSQTLSAKARESLVNCPYKTCSSHPPKNGGVK